MGRSKNGVVVSTGLLLYLIEEIGEDKKEITNVGAEQSVLMSVILTI